MTVFYFFIVSRQLCPLPEGRLVVQLLCPFKFEWSLVQRRTLPQPLPRWSLLGWVQRRSLFAKEGGHDDPSKPKHLPLSIQGTCSVLYLSQNKKPLQLLKLMQSLSFLFNGGQTTKMMLKVRHQADIPVPPYTSESVQCYSIVCSIFPFTYDSVKTWAHCSGVVLNTLSLIKQEHA